MLCISSEKQQLTIHCSQNTAAAARFHGSESIDPENLPQSIEFPGADGQFCQVPGVADSEVLRSVKVVKTSKSSVRGRSPQRPNAGSPPGGGGND